MKISGSILGLKEQTKEELKKIEQSGIDYVHIDVMDGLFVFNNSYPYEQVKNIVNDFKYDVHLMVKDVKKYIDEFSLINPEYITFHLEVSNTEYYINYLKQKNIKVGIAINPKTDVEKIYPYLKDIDLVLIMSVEPGRGGQKFIENSYLKIDKLYEYRKQNNLKYKISIDGGINDVVLKKLTKIDIAVIGSYITNGNYQEQVTKIRGEI